MKGKTLSHPLQGPEHVDIERQIDEAIADAQAMYRAYAEAHGISEDDARQLLGHFEDQAHLRQRLVPTTSAAPWLDTNELPEPPRPWSEDDWERDRRRADAAEVDMPRAVWERFAEAGQDGVHVLLQERLERHDRETKLFHANARSIAEQRERDRVAAGPQPDGPGWQPAAPDPGTLSRFGHRP